jgi:hypothetical protein
MLLKLAPHDWSLPILGQQVSDSEIRSLINAIEIYAIDSRYSSKAMLQSLPSTLYTPIRVFDMLVSLLIGTRSRVAAIEILLSISYIP